MGLAPYGTDSILKMFPIERWCGAQGGYILCNSRLRYPPGAVSARLGRRKSFADLVTVGNAYVRMQMRRVTRPLRFRMLGGSANRVMFTEPTIFPEIRLPRPRSRR